ncbi:unnamed protein product, partial [Allacma fusca]
MASNNTKTRNWKIPKRNAQTNDHQSDSHPNSHKNRRTDKFKSGEVKSNNYSSHNTPRPHHKSHNERELDRFNSFFSPGTQSVYISEYERMIMDCEKLTIIQR